MSALAILGGVGVALLALLLSLVQSLLADEVKGWLPHIACAIARGAVRRLPREQRERYGEEWLAELDAHSDRRLTAVVRACGLWLAAGQMRAGAVQGRVPIHERLIATTVLVIVAPLFVAICVAIRRDSPGPVIYRRPAIGANGRPVVLYRFRTTPLYVQLSLPGVEPAPPPQRTRVGRWLRRHSLDELPYFVNVARGHARLVSSPMTWRDVVEQMASTLRRVTRHR